MFLDDLTRELEYNIDTLVTAKEDLIQENLSNNIWYIPRVTNNNKREKIKHAVSGGTHPCPFPEEMVKRVIKASTEENDLVLDIFLGSGTVGKVAEELNRNWLGIEKEMEYCEIAESRIKPLIEAKKSENKDIKLKITKITESWT